MYYFGKRATKAKFFQDGLKSFQTVSMFAYFYAKSLPNSLKLSSKC